MSLGARMQCSVCDGYLEGGTERSRCRCQRTDVVDPGPEAVDKILDGLENFVDPPAEVARKARRLRAHITALRDRLGSVHESAVPKADAQKDTPND